MGRVSGLAKTKPPDRPGKFRRTVQQRRAFEPRPGSRLELILPDKHYPVHDKRAEACVDLMVATLRPGAIGILGDWLDCGGFSRHPVRSIEERAQNYLDAEVAPCRATLAEYEKHTDEVWMLEGNHEFRAGVFMVQGGGVLQDLAEMVSPKALLSAGRTKPFTWIPYVSQGQVMSHRRIATDLIAIHGWTHSKHAAAKVLEIAKSFSVVFGHIHRAQSFASRNPILEREYEAWCPGTLSGLQPIYGHSTPSEWNHGVSLVWVSDDGQRWTAYNVKVRNGVCVLPDGRKIDGTKGTVA